MKEVFSKKFLWPAMLLFIVTSIVFPNQKVYAQGSVPVSDMLARQTLGRIAASSALSARANTSLQTKETFLDGLAYAVINIVIAQLADSLTNWINSGFQGAPGFISNPENFFLNVANEAGGQVIANLSGGILCSPFGDSLTFGLNLQLNIPARRLNHIRCTLSTMLQNVQNFKAFVGGNFNVGVNQYGTGQSGLSALLEVSQPQNNPYGAFILADSAMQAEISRQKELAQMQANWNSGFKSVTKKVGEGINKVITTPGRVVEQQLNDSLASGKHRIEAADEISEVVGALLGQLISTITNGLANGNNASEELTYDQNGVPTAASGNSPFTPIVVCLDPRSNVNPGNIPCQQPISLTSLPACPAIVYTNGVSNVATSTEPVGQGRIVDTYVACQLPVQPNGGYDLPDCPVGNNTMPDGSGCKIVETPPPPIVDDTGVGKTVQIISIGKRSYQSSTYSYYTANYANDGNMQAEYTPAIGGGISLTTLDQKHAWWEVDLGSSDNKEKEISYIDVARVNSGAFGDYNPYTWQIIAKHNVDDVGTVLMTGTGVMNYAPTAPIIARYIRIYSIDYRDVGIGLAEVTVRGRDVQAGAGGGTGTGTGTGDARPDPGNPPPAGTPPTITGL